MSRDKSSEHLTYCMTVKCSVMDQCLKQLHSATESHKMQIFSTLLTTMKLCPLEHLSFCELILEAGYPIIKIVSTSANVVVSHSFRTALCDIIWNLLLNAHSENLALT